MQKMIAIIVILMFLNAIHCEKENDFCGLMKTNGRYEGIQVFRSSRTKVNVMYNNGNQWTFKIEDENIHMDYNVLNLSISKEIINRFSGNDYVCDVRHQIANKTLIETNCFDGRKSTTDSDSQYEPKAIIFRASSDSTNEWVVIYSRNGSLISCYSPKQSPSLVTDKTKCKQLIGRNRTVVETIDPSIVDSIDGIVDFGYGKSIFGHHIFFRRDGRPVFCSKLIDDTKITCKEEITPIFPECFPPPEKSWWEKWGKTAAISVAVIVVIIVVLLICYFVVKRYWPQKPDTGLQSDESLVTIPTLPPSQTEPLGETDKTPSSKPPPTALDAHLAQLALKAKLQQRAQSRQRLKSQSSSTSEQPVPQQRAHAPPTPATKPRESRREPRPPGVSSSTKPSVPTTVPKPAPTGVKKQVSEKPVRSSLSSEQRASKSGEKKRSHASQSTGPPVAPAVPTPGPTPRQQEVPRIPDRDLTPEQRKEREKYHKMLRINTKPY